jgi:hypothetical protein
MHPHHFNDYLSQGTNNGEELNHLIIAVLHAICFCFDSCFPIRDFCQTRKQDFDLQLTPARIAHSNVPFAAAIDISPYISDTEALIDDIERDLVSSQHCFAPPSRTKIWDTVEEFETGLSVQHSSNCRV